MAAETSERPRTPGELDPAALTLLERHGQQLMLTARRYAATPEDAEDAFQRSFEILLSRGSGVREADLLPWLKTVVKHEALALRRQRERQAPLVYDGRAVEPVGGDLAADELAEAREEIAQSTEALAQLKPHEVRALVLRAKGYSYREICELTDWSYTKVNRALVEGRRAFRRRLTAIELGYECRRLEPSLSRLADGEASAEEVASLRPHLKCCLDCRARLKQFRATPNEVAALAPAGAAIAAADGGGTLRGVVEGVLGALQQKTAALGERAHAAAELVSGKKVAAVAASAAALAGGGTAIEEIALHPDPPHVPVVQADQRPAPSAPSDRDRVETIEQPAATPTEPAVTSSPASEPEPAPAVRPDPANEFDPAAAAQASQPTSPQSSPAPTSPAGSPTSPAPSVGTAAPAASSPSGTSEFAP